MMLFFSSLLYYYSPLFCTSHKVHPPLLNPAPSPTHPLIQITLLLYVTIALFFSLSLSFYALNRRRSCSLSVCIQVSKSFFPLFYGSFRLFLWLFFPPHFKKRSYCLQHGRFSCSNNRLIPFRKVKRITKEEIHYCYLIRDVTCLGNWNLNVFYLNNSSS